MIRITEKEYRELLNMFSDTLKTYSANGMAVKLPLEKLTSIAIIDFFINKVDNADLDIIRDNFAEFRKSGKFNFKEEGKND